MLDQNEVNVTASGQVTVPALTAAELTTSGQKWLLNLPLNRARRPQHQQAEQRLKARMLTSHDEERITELSHLPYQCEIRTFARMSILAGLG